MDVRLDFMVAGHGMLWRRTSTVLQSGGPSREHSRSGFEWVSKGSLHKVQQLLAEAKFRNVLERFTPSIRYLTNDDLLNTTKAVQCISIQRIEKSCFINACTDKAAKIRAQWEIERRTENKKQIYRLFKNRGSTFRNKAYLMFFASVNRL